MKNSLFAEQINLLFIKRYSKMEFLKVSSQKHNGHQDSAALYNTDTSAKFKDTYLENKLIPLLVSHNPTF